MAVGIRLIVIGVALMLFGARRGLLLLGSSNDDEPVAEWFNAGKNSQTEPRFPALHFIGTILGPLLGGAILIVFGINYWTHQV